MPAASHGFAGHATLQPCDIKRGANSCHAVVLLMSRMDGLMTKSHVEALVGGSAGFRNA
jgi:hypothetical protein